MTNRKKIGNETEGFRQIFKSSVLIGGGQFMYILLTTMKNKGLAILVGPSGIGIIGIYTALVGTISPLASFGIGPSAVREISDSIASENHTRTEFFIKIIRRILLLTAIVATLLLIAFAEPIARLSFGPDFKREYIVGVVLIGAFLFFDILSAGEKSILQGFRKIVGLAKGQVYSGIAALVASLAIILVWGERGIPLSLGLSAAFAYIIFRKLAGATNRVSNANTPTFDIKPLFLLGLAFWIVSIIGSVAAYAVRLIILSESGLNTVGLYQASWGLVTIGFNLVLAALATDLYPRLVSTINVPGESVRMVNQQVQLGLIIALPIVLTIQIFAPEIIKIFLSEQFLGAGDLAKWLAISGFLRVFIYPLSFVVIAHNAKRLFVITSLLYELIHLPILLISLKLWGISGVGISYVIAYAIILIISTILTKRYFGFHWTVNNKLGLLVSALIIGTIIMVQQWLGTTFLSYFLQVLLFGITIITGLAVMKKKLDLNLKEIVRKNRYIR